MDKYLHYLRKGVNYEYALITKDLILQIVLQMY